MPCFWQTVHSRVIEQGDLLKECAVPLFRPMPDDDGERIHIADAEIYDVIVVTQTCDLLNGEIRLAAVCPTNTVADFCSEHGVPRTNKGADKMNAIRKGRVEGLHLLSPTSDSDDPWEGIIVDFRKIFSLPVEVLGDLAEQMGDRPRLESPYLEHFSQGFARFFMRVGLPENLPEFKPAKAV